MLSTTSTIVESAWCLRLKLKNDEVLTSFVFKFNWRHYITARYVVMALPAAVPAVQQATDRPNLRLGVGLMVGRCALKPVLKVESAWLRRLKLKIHSCSDPHAC